MALSAFTQWDVRSSGSTSNGGGFILGASGTDYSQQDSAQFSGTDLASISSLVVASVSHNFTSVDVGNLIQISGGTGFTAGFYQIVSCASNQATLDRSPGTVGVTGTWAVGGGLLTLAVAVANMVQSNTCWIKSGTYTVTATQSFVFSGSGSGGPTIFEGYNTTHGDLGTKPLLTTATNSVNLFTLANTNFLVFRNLSLSNTAGTRGDGFTAPTSASSDSNCVLIDRCLLDGFNHGVMFDGQITYSVHALVVSNTEVKNCVSHGIVNTYETTLINCYIHANGGSGWTWGTYVPFLAGKIFTAINCVFYANNYAWDSSATAGSTGLSVVFSGCVISDSTSDGIKHGGYLDLVVMNCIFYNNGGYGVNNTISGNNLGFLRNAAGNAYGANVSGPGLNWISADITLTADPFTARTSNNFALNNAAGGGALLRALGFPGVTSFGTGYRDVGPLQSSTGGGGGGGALLINPGMTGGIGG